MSIKRPNLFNGSRSRSLHSNSTSTFDAGGSEVDLRDELDELFFGYKSGIRHGHQTAIRHLRRTSEGKPIACSCMNEITRDGDYDCSYCLGEKYLWDEAWYWTYSMYSASNMGLANRLKYMPSGALRVDFKVFFFRYDTNLRYGDKIIEMKLDEEGNLVVPYIRETIYFPQTIQKYRSDNGRIEYIAAPCREEDAIRLDSPE